MAPAGQQPALHSLMRLQEYGGMVVLQPNGESGPQGQSLACDLQTGKLMFADNVDKMQTGFTTIYGIMGIAKLHTGSVLIAVTGARKVCLIVIWHVHTRCCWQVAAADILVCCYNTTFSGFSGEATQCSAGGNPQRPSCVSSHRHQDVWQAPLEQQR